ncbi:MAG: DJ-1/PfpI family protein [Lentisphaerae bacterium]|jgi:4-methyl-5(b-hydroxyethyl)-thiazole monophosphate biosynthesis|nr:DJ-1/PfpI family protein [Lentisphaerota bacterium]
MKVKKAVVVLANGFEEIEALSIVDVLRRGEVEVSVLALDTSQTEVVGAHEIRVIADGVWNDDVINSADAIVLPGGLGCMQALRADAKVLDAIRKFNAEGKYVAAICASPAVLQEAGVLGGRKAVCYPGMEDHIKDAEYCEEASVVRDGNIVTGSGPATAMEFALEVLETLHGKQVRDGVAGGLLFKA